MNGYSDNEPLGKAIENAKKRIDYELGKAKKQKPYVSSFVYSKKFKVGEIITLIDNSSVPIEQDLRVVSAEPNEETGGYTIKTIKV